MTTPTSADVADLANHCKRVWLLRFRSSACALAIPLLCGCGHEPKAPEPTANSHPHEITKLKISVEPGSGVTGVRVETLWTVGDLSCAPHMGWPSGASITRQVNVLEKVEKLDANDYVATIVDDRFAQDNCRWRIGGYAVNYMHDHTILGLGGGGLYDYEKSNPLKLTCVPRDNPPVCWPRSREAFFRSRFKGVFNVTEEIKK